VGSFFNLAFSITFVIKLVAVKMAVRLHPKSSAGRVAPANPELLTVTRPELLVDGSDAEFRTLIHLSMSFSRWISTVRDGFGALIGISGVQYEIMILVSRLQGNEGITVGDLSSAIRLSGAFTTIETGKLVDKGLLEKSADLRDRRRVRLRLTSGGRKVLLSLAPYQRQINDVAFANLKATELQELSGLLGELLPGMDRAVNLINFILKQEGGPLDVNIQ
jgi:MarR family transcriptional regulator, organic hydroperoxide resistance regulator